MKFTAASIALLSTCMASTTVATTANKSLRHPTSAGTASSSHATKSEGSTAAALYRKESPNGRSLEGSNYRMASILGGSIKDLPSKIEKTKKDAKRAKFQKAKVAAANTKAAGQHNKSLHGDAPAHHFKPKDKTIHQDATTSNTNFNINIIGGTGAGPNEFPYFVNMNGCGGTLIGPDIVLGAAHCGNFNGEIVNIGGGTSGRIVQQQNHPNYNDDTRNNDIALYRLASPVGISNTGTSVVVNTAGSIPSAGTDLTTMGFGLTSEDGQESNVLLKVEVPFVTNAQCLNAYGNEFVPSTMLCAGEGGKDSCHGDSGGPIVIENGNNHVLVGVVSWGEGCADPDFPGVYARVSSAVGWIESVACDDWNSSVNGLCGGGNTSPVAAPAPTPIPPSPSTPTSANCFATLELEFKTDTWPEETSFLVQNDQQGVLYDENSFDTEEQYAYSICIEADSCTTFRFDDSYGDGLDGNGYMYAKFDGQVLFDGWDLGFGLEWTLDTGGCNSGNQPIMPPVSAPQTAPTTPPPPPTGGSCTMLSVELRTDDWPEETIIFLEDDSNGDMIWDESDFDFDANTDYSFSECIPDDKCIVLDVTDTWGDGLLNEGYFTVTYGSDILYDDWDFGYGFSIYLGDDC